MAERVVGVRAWKGLIRNRRTLTFISEILAKSTSRTSFLLCRSLSCMRSSQLYVIVFCCCCQKFDALPGSASCFIIMAVSEHLWTFWYRVFQMAPSAPFSAGGRTTASARWGRAATHLRARGWAVNCRSCGVCERGRATGKSEGERDTDRWGSRVCARARLCCACLCMGMWTAPPPPPPRQPTLVLFVGPECCYLFLYLSPRYWRSFYRQCSTTWRKKQS